MKKYIAVVLFIIANSTGQQTLMAVKAYPYPVTVTQPDGTQITMVLKGDEFFHYKTTLDGYLIETDAANIFRYAQVDKYGQVIPTAIKANDIAKRTQAERDFLLQIKPGVEYMKQFRAKRSMHRAKKMSVSESVPRKVYPVTGTPKSLVILVNFKDVKFVTPSPLTAFANLLNQPGYSTNGGTGSAKDYFHDNSMGKFNPQFDVVGPVNLPDTMGYYGKNLTNGGDDANPQKMVIDACTQASKNGVDFSKYDTDNDGYVDNIFIYYAGYNEAEHGPENSVWPHRWTLNNTATRFNGKIVYDYACTSELRGKVGTNMCGIGTFVHEFGHVLGLDDYYPTNDSTFFTLDDWSVMDGGPYLNIGRTPPSYSAYDRFYLDWLQPAEIGMPGTYVLDELPTSNQAFLVSPYGNHNLNGANPSPVEFFLFENRQKKGWDLYLPGHGMLVTHIFYNPTTWNNNEINNDPNAMGVDIVEADGRGTSSTLSGDPFPGTKMVHSYIPTLRSGFELFDKTISLIDETSGVISFELQNENIPISEPVAQEATDTTTGSFIANWTIVAKATGYYLTAYNVSPGESMQSEGFDTGSTTTNGWTITAKNRSTSRSYSGKNAPAIQLSNSSDSIETEEYLLPVAKFSFFIRSLNGYNGYVKVEGRSGDAWQKIDSIYVDISLYGTKTYPLNTNLNFNKFRLTYTKMIGDVVIDDVTASFDQNLEFNAREKWVSTNSDTLMNLIPNREYFYKVRASKRLLNPDKTVFYENMSGLSNQVSVKTLENRQGNIFRVSPDGYIQLLIPTTNLTVRVFNVLGQQVREFVPTSNIFKIEGLRKGQVYIIEAGQNRAKIIL
ncbi:MAG TPA: M6 family metalloprotease domain-containing protein [Paludibacter sp.]|nr:M6 family metalloprotease domain-containing protein [Paludibacter sp.]